MNEKRYDASRLEDALDRHSGLLGISGVTSDMQALLEMRERDPHASQAVEMFCYSARKHIAAMSAALGGLDMLVFTGGIGENAPAVRAQICSELAFLGISLDLGANTRNERSINSPRGGARVLVIPTNEELTIARHSCRLLAELRHPIG
jgi:acetate kinase